LLKLVLMLSQKARYAIHALLVLAQRDDDEPMMIADIAEEARVPRKFLEQILLALKKRGIVRSQRGRLGGYLLGRSPQEISFADIIRETDGPLALEPLRQRHGLSQMRRLRGRDDLRHPQGAAGRARRHRGRPRIAHARLGPVLPAPRPPRGVSICDGPDTACQTWPKTLLTWSTLSR
jgi:Rrf2 family protein